MLRKRRNILIQFIIFIILFATFNIKSNAGSIEIKDTISTMKFEAVQNKSQENIMKDKSDNLNVLDSSLQKEDNLNIKEEEQRNDSNVIQGQLDKALHTIDKQDRLISKFGFFLSLIGVLATFAFVILGVKSFKDSNELRTILDNYNLEVKNTYNILRWETFEQTFKKGLEDLERDDTDNRVIYNLINVTSPTDIEYYEDNIIHLLKDDDRLLDAAIIRRVLEVFLNTNVYNSKVLSFLIFRHSKVNTDVTKNKWMQVIGDKIDQTVGLTDSAKKELFKIKIKQNKR